MPSVSRKQQQAMAIAEHAPGKLYKRNKGLAEMSKPQLSEFASSVVPAPGKGKKRKGTA